MAENNVVVIIFIIFEFTVVGILNYLDFINIRKLFCEEEIQNKKCTKLSKQGCVYKNICKYARKVEENEKNY